MTETLSLPQLNFRCTSTGYQQWRLEVVTALGKNGLLGHIDGSTPPPPAVIADGNGNSYPNPDFESWRKQDQLILAWLSKSFVDPFARCFLASSKNAQRLLQRLDREHKIAVAITAYYLRHHFENIKKGSDTCAQYFSRIQYLVHGLLSCGITVPDEELVCLTLQGLGPGYASFALPFTARYSSQPLTMTDLRRLLLVEAAAARLQDHKFQAPLPVIPEMGSAPSRPSSPCAQSTASALPTEFQAQLDFQNSLILCAQHKAQEEGFVIPFDVTSYPIWTNVRDLEDELYWASKSSIYDD